MNAPLRTLFVDDSEDDVLLLLHALREGGFETIHERVQTAAALEAALKGRSWDIVLCDYVMPGFDAPAALRLIRDLAPDTPVIVVSGAVGEETAVETIKLGATDYLMKDRLTRLGRSVSYALDQKRLRQERLDSEKARDRSLSLILAALESTADGILIVNTELHIEAFNTKFSRMWQLPLTLLAGRDEMRLRRALAEPLQHPESFLERVCYLYAHPEEESFDTLLFKDGRIFERYSRPQWVDGAVVGRVWSFRDITVRKQAEDALESERTLLRTIFDLLPDHLYVKDTESRFITCNYRCARIMGADTPADTIGKTDADFYPAEVAAMFRADEVTALSGTPVINKEESFIRRDGVRQYTLTTKLPLRDRHGIIIGIVGNGRDITERKQLEEQFRQAQKMEAIGQLSGGVAHDFNNLLTVILGNLDLIRASFSPTPEVAALLDQITQAGNRAANLTRQLLAFSRRQVMQAKELDLNRVVANTSQLLSRLIGDAVVVETDLAHAALTVRADPVMLEQVLLNLCLNARDAMPGGGRLLVETRAVEFDEESVRRNPLSRRGCFACLRVSDTGTGISKENLPHLFEPFFTTKEIGRGTGLGLASVYGIVQQHQGWIAVESELGRGTTFTVHIPLLGGLPPKETSQAQPESAPRGSETILIVEDDAAVQTMSKNALLRLGYHVLLANNGVEARKVWQAHHAEIHLMLADMVMPEGISGRDLAKLFKKEKPALRVILISGYHSDIAGVDLSRTDFDTFLGKPFDVHSLAKAVRNSLDRPPARPQT